MRTKTKDRRPKTSSRRGVLLLVILALLAMFGLIGVAYVVITGHARRSAEGYRRVEQTLVVPQNDLHQAFLQVAHGSTNLYSALVSHSLLEDMYGNGGVTCRIVAFPSPPAPGPDPIARCGNNLIEFNYQIFDSALGWIADPAPSRRMGCVLTFTRSNVGLAGQSTRIVGCNPAPPNYPQMQTTENAVLPAVGDQFVINGVPFSGAGFGYDPNTGKCDAKTTVGGIANCEVALLPNHLANKSPAVSANEDYDAPDYQNMLHGAVVPGTPIMPSLHRPELVNYWAKRIPAAAGNWKNLPSDLLYSIILRPLPLANGHPNFTGSNPNFDAVNGPWDVDNDGDGVADSIWVDLGMPARSAPDGKMYKPLFAILCQDMDGRLNLNAHGCLAQTTTTYYMPIDPTPYTFAGASAPTPAVLPRGQGYGPAEINLLALFPNLAQLTPVMQSRYGLDLMPGIAGADPLSVNRWFEYKSDYWGFLSGPPYATYKPDAYGSPPDTMGMGAVALDVGGRVLYMGMGVTTVDNPYESNLARNAARALGLPGNAIDNHYGAAELERLLRPFDRDTLSLPSRLYALTYDAILGKSSLQDKRHQFTTESWDVPCPAGAIPNDKSSILLGMAAALPPSLKSAVLGGTSPPYQLLDYTVVMLAYDIKTANPAFTDAQVVTAIGSLLPRLFPPELMAGLRMDVNRPFGNGWDDNGNSVVDEPGEVETMPQVNAAGAFVPNIDFDAVDGVDVNGDGVVDANDRLLARQLYSRYLYVLTMLVADTKGMKLALGDEEAVARYVAQWAANVVDFRDRDSIMTSFDYDVRLAYAPADRAAIPGGSITKWDPTWKNPVKPNDPPHRVWGCERPELLIAETLAFHDRRTEDTSSDSTNKKTTDTPPDPDFDQRRMPEGSLFVKLFNPWTTQEPRPTELCDSYTGGVDVTKVSPGGSPVWRLIIVDGADASKDPDDPDATKQPSIERAVYFVDSTKVATLPAGGTIQFRPSAGYSGQIVPILPGRYMVVGPGDAGASGAATTYIGYLTGKTAGDSTTRRITLTPGNNATGLASAVNSTALPQVAVFNDGATDDLGKVTIHPPVAVVINDPRRLSISEPVGGYPAVDPNGIAYDPVNGYTTPYDHPQDADGPMPTTIQKNDRTDNIKVVHLQRLANPLMAYDATNNPYRTVDSMPIDLTTFNGVSADTDPQATDGPNKDKFYSRQRGQNNDSSNLCDLWRQEPFGTPGGAPSPKANTSAVPVAATGHYYNSALNHALGYLDDPFGKPGNLPGYTGDPQTTSAPPFAPFPWLTWNNRPFISQLELMLVPAAKSRDLLRTFALSPPAPTPYSNAAQPFAHLPNFFFSQASGTSFQLNRLFEYLRVPSRFIGTSTQVYDPAAFTGAPQYPHAHFFYPPFNWISAYRDPGRINLNTVYTPEVMLGLMNNYPGLGDPLSAANFWSKFLISRRGKAGNVFDIDPLGTYPTHFPNPFRSSGCAGNVPLGILQPAREVDVTLLRADSAAPDRPLFEFDSLADASYVGYLNNPERNPYFRYQSLQRLSNLVTTRSNVYAVWVTVGYFEVTPWPLGIDPNHPDGYQLGQELGADTGDVQRHRAFYLFDRSIPVGFQRGQDHNVEKAILLKRIIE